MEASSWRGRIGDWLWFLVFAGLSSAWCLMTAWQLGATFDEVTDLQRGMEFWRNGSHGQLVRVGSMPLPMDVATLPAFLWEQAHDTRLEFWQAPPPEHVLFWCRAVMLVFWWLLLVYARAAGRHIAGPWGGRLAVALLACEPTLLAHASLATKDIAISATLLACVYHFRMGRGAGWGWRVLLPGIWFGIALLSKASALAFGCLCFLAVEIEYLARSGALALPETEGARGWRRFAAAAGLAWLRHAWAQARPLRRDGVQIYVLGFLLMMLYCWSDWKPEASFQRWAGTLQEGPARNTMVWLADNLCIFPNGTEGLVRQVMHNLRGHATFLLGESHPRSIPFYFPIALSMKFTVPLMVLLAGVVILAPRSLASWVCAVAGILFLFSLQCRVQIGIRLVLPLVIFMIVGLGSALASALKTLGFLEKPGFWCARWRSHLLSGTTAAGLLWAAWSSFSVWPHGLCYVNEIWGGTETGYLRVSDSNYDWGQGVHDLARWQQRHNVSNLDVWYFGTDPTLKILPVRQVNCPQFGTPESLADAVRGRYLAVSTTFLYGGYSCPPAIVHWLRGQKPVDRTQTFLIYDFTEDDAGAE